MSTIIDRIEGQLDVGSPDPSVILELTCELVGSWRDELPKVTLHPLGFFYFPLKKANGRTLRLHVWHDLHRPVTPGTSPYHTHSWTLLSHVLVGSITNHEPELIVSYHDADYRLYDIGGDSVTDLIEPTSVTVKFLPGTSETYANGETYSMPSGEFHATDCAAGAFAATMCLVESVPGGGEITLGPVKPVRLNETRGSASIEMVQDVISSLAKHLAERRQTGGGVRTPLG